MPVLRPSYRDSLLIIGERFQEKETALGRGAALRQLKSDLDNLWRIARDEELALLGTEKIDG